MRFLRQLLHAFQARRHARELAEEMETHRAFLEAEQQGLGLTASDAQFAARRSMGNTTLARESSRAVWIVPWIESVWQDLRYAARSLAAQPGFTAMALLALILGIGLNTSLFTVMNAAMFRGWDVPSADRMVRIETFGPRRVGGGVIVRGAQYAGRLSKTMSGTFLERSMAMRLDKQSIARTVDFVSGAYFPTLQLSMALGRGFGEAEDSEAQPKPVAVLSHSLWQSVYAADPGIVGRTIELDDIAFTVMGVAPEGFQGTEQLGTEVWVPLQALRLARPNDSLPKEVLTNPTWCCSAMAGRLAPGVSLEQAQAELSGLYSQFLKEAQMKPVEIRLRSTALIGPDHTSQQRAVWIITAGFGSILLLACANVSNLLLARSAARKQEIGIRVAIGAGRWRLVRQLLTESLLLASIASACGLALAYWLPGPLLRSLEAEGLPNLTPDLTVFYYSVGISFAAALLFGLTPALAGTRDLSLQPGSRSTARYRMRGVLLGVQVAISVVLLVSAALLVRGIQSVYSSDLGFRADGVSAVTVALPSNRYTEEGKRAFYRDLEDRLRAMNGGQPVGLSQLTPLGEFSSITDFRPTASNSKESQQTWVQWITPGYFDILHIPILAGRNLKPEERLGEAIVINETLARRSWPDESPLGKTVKIGMFTPVVVGVVRDSKVYGVRPVPPTYFAPFFVNQTWYQPVALVPTPLATSTLDLVRKLEPAAATKSTTLLQRMDDTLGEQRAAVKAASALGLLALLLATIGVYGVISYSVEQRRKEIGIRMALGARASEVVALILRRNSRAVLAGLAVGLLLAAGVSVVLESELHGVSRLDPIAYAAVLSIFALAAVAASIAPAWRTARTDASRVLHAE